MSTVFPEDEFDDWLSRAVGQSGSRSPSARGISGAGGDVAGALKRLHQQVRGGSAHEPICTATGTPQFALCAAFNERLKQECSQRNALKAEGKSPVETSSLLMLEGVINLMVDDSIPDGCVKPMNEAAREALQRFEFAQLLQQTDSGKPPLSEGDDQ